MATATFNTAFTSEGAESGDVSDIPDYCAVFDDASKTNWITNFDLTSTHSGLTLGQTISYAANALAFTLTEGANSNDPISGFGLVECLHGMFRADRYLTFHTDDPGTGGTDNEIDGIAPTLLDVSNLDYAE